MTGVYEDGACVDSFILKHVLQTLIDILGFLWFLIGLESLYGF